MRAIYWDTETHLIKKGNITPRLVCVSWAERETPEGILGWNLPESTLTFADEVALEGLTASRDGISRGLLDRDDGIEWVRHHLEDDGVTLVGDNVAYDFGVVIASAPRDEYTRLMRLVFEKYEKGLVHDTDTRQKLIDIATGEMKFHNDEDTGEPVKTRYALAELARRLLKKFLKKKDTWRLRYAELDGVPLAEWPEEAIRYAIDDAVTTLEVHEKQDEIAGGPIPDSDRQHRAAWGLHLMSAWGIRTDGVMVAKLKAELAAEFAGMMNKLRPSGLLKIRPARVPTRGKLKGTTVPEKITKFMKAIQERVVSAYESAGEKVIMTEPSDKFPYGQVSTAKKTLLEAGKLLIDRGKETEDPSLVLQGEQLVTLAEAGKIGKLLQTYIPVLESGTVTPINARYNGLVETGRTSCARPNCFDAETEILTADGWQRFDQYSGAKVAQFNPDSLWIGFVNPTAIIVEDAPEEMVTLKNEHINLCVTPDHRCLLQDRKKGYWFDVSADGYPEDCRQWNAGHYAGGAGIPFSEAELTLLCATQADGSYHGDGVGLDFSFYKKRKVERFRDALLASGASYSEGIYDSPDGPRTRFRIHKSDLSKRLRERLGPTKTFGPWVLDMNRSQLDHFVDEVFRWDGCVTRMSHYASSIPVNSDWVQIAITLSGRRAKVRRYHNGNPNAKVSLQVDVSPNAYSLTTNVERGLVSTSPGDKVYCVSVPTSYIVVRRGGAAIVTGNCQNPPRQGGIRECFVPRPGWVYAFSDYDTLELRALSQVCLDMLGWSNMAEALRRGEDLHISFAADMLGISYEETKKRYESGDPEAKEYRQQAKPANFGFPGGMAAASFREYAEGYNIFLTEPQAKKLHGDWFAKWPEMRPYFELVSSLSEQEAPIKQLRSGRVRGGASFCAIANGFFQGLAADGAKEAIWRVAWECYVDEKSPLFGCRPVFFLHDELGIEIPYMWWGRKRSAAAAARLSAVMIEAMEGWIPDVPITAKPILTRRWYKGADPVYIDGVIVPSKPIKEGNKTKWVADLNERDAA